MPFRKGDCVRYVVTQQVGSVVDVLRRGGMDIYSVLINGQIAQIPETRLELYVVTDEFERCKKGQFGTNEQFALTNTTFKVKNQSTNSIASMMASKTDFKPYQYIPLLKFLYSNNRRLLIADEVGLGKTIEAGHIMLELKARHELRNALIICPNSLLNKWHDELLERFDLNFRLYGKGQSRQFLDDLVQQKEALFAIVNYEKIRNPKITEYIANHNIAFDLVICDEAHKMRHHTTGTHQGARIFIEKARSAIFLTATPIMNHEDNLFWLLNLLDKATYNNKYMFSNALKENEPFVRALSQLGKMDQSLDSIMSNLKMSSITSLYQVGDVLYERIQTIDEKYKSIPLFKRILEQSKKEDNYENRVQIQSDISSLNVINGIFTRNRKRDVLYDVQQAQRAAHPVYIPFTDEEKKAYYQYLNAYRREHTYIDHEGKERWYEGHMLGYITLERQLASSLYSYIDGALEALKKPDAKFNALCDIYSEIQAQDNKKKLIIFAVYNHTISYLQARFGTIGIKALVISGTVDISERKKILLEFKNQPDNKILIASEVGSEGLDMQFCDALVNYDLPWNPMVVEQRIGRIDRLGQNSEVINIYNMVMQDTIHERIYYRLLDRINIFTSCIGDLEAILDSNFMDGKTLQDAIDDLTKDFYRLDLTERQKEARADTLQMALIREKSNLDTINEKFQDTLTNDVYFRNEINSMVRNYRYITAREIINYIKSIIQVHLTTCELRQVANNPEEYIFIIPQSSGAILTSFLTKYQPIDIQHPLEYTKFINKIRGEYNIKLTFNRDYARDHSDIIYVDPFHPLVLACANYFENNPQSNNTYRFQLSAERFTDLKIITSGEYFLGIYRFKIEKTIYHAKQCIDMEVPVIYSISERSIITNKETTYRIMGVAQQEAKINDSIPTLDSDIIEDLRMKFTDYIDQYADKTLSDMQIHLESSMQMELDRLNEYYTDRINQQHDLVSELITLQGATDEESQKRYRTLPMQKQNLTQLYLEFEEAKNKLDCASVTLKELPMLTSLSNIAIY